MTPKLRDGLKDVFKCVYKSLNTQSYIGERRIATLRHMSSAFRVIMNPRLESSYRRHGQRYLGQEHDCETACAVLDDIYNEVFFKLSDMEADVPSNMWQPLWTSTMATYGKGDASKERPVQDISSESNVNSTNGNSGESGESSGGGGAGGSSSSGNEQGQEGEKTIEDEDVESAGCEVSTTQDHDFEGCEDSRSGEPELIKVAYQYGIFHANPVDIDYIIEHDLHDSKIEFYIRWRGCPLITCESLSVVSRYKPQLSHYIEYVKVSQSRRYIHIIRCAPELENLLAIP